MRAPLREATSVRGIRYVWMRGQEGYWSSRTDWIEYIPSASLVEHDNCLWWRSYDASSDCMRYIQVTEGPMLIRLTPQA